MKQTTLFQNNVSSTKHEKKYDKLTEPTLKDIKYIPSNIDSDYIEEFDDSVDDWVYPINYSIRDYQFQIVQECLFKNTLVCLPTGLGKTFIATVVIYNFYRWYPKGKIIFIAPTRQLVEQQSSACRDVVPINYDDITIMTGSTNQEMRKTLWKQKRVFFLTAQVVVNDLNNDICPGTKAVLLVLDEAHKATGNHAYCQVIRVLTGDKYKNRLFRVIGLTATPGNTTEVIQEVIQNLLIAHIELRTDQCKDIQQYSFNRCIEEVIVPFGPEITRVKEVLFSIIEPYMQELIFLQGLPPNENYRYLTSFGLLSKKEIYKSSNCMSNQRVYSLFQICHILYYSIETLQQHGQRSMFRFLSNTIENGSNTYIVKELFQNQALMKLYDDLVRADQTQTFRGSHPKLDKVKMLVKNHFEKHRSNEPPCAENAKTDCSTRVIVFSDRRESVSEIHEMLSRELDNNLVRSVPFMGRSNQNRNRQDQMLSIQQFIDGTANVLVSTCIGEEGLDIGEVDLIICFDAKRSPIQLVQRIGRTGRKREGKIVMLLSEGREVAKYKSSVQKKSHIYKVIFDGYKNLRFYPDNPKMVPVNKIFKVTYEKFNIEKQKPMLHKMKKISKVKQLSISNFVEKLPINSLIRKIEFNIERISDNKLMSVYDINNDRKESMYKTLVDYYNMNKYKTSWFNLQRCNPIGHSTVTEDFVCVMRLGEEHLTNQHNVLFHFSDSRKRRCDLTDDSNVKNDELLSQHSLSSFSLSEETSSILDEKDTDYDNLSMLIAGNEADSNVYLSKMDLKDEIAGPSSSKNLFRMLDCIEDNKPDFINELDELITDFKDMWSLPLSMNDIEYPANDKMDETMDEEEKQEFDNCSSNDLTKECADDMFEDFSFSDLFNDKLNDDTKDNNNSTGLEFNDASSISKRALLSRFSTPFKRGTDAVCSGLNAASSVENASKTILSRFNNARMYFMNLYTNILDDCFECDKEKSRISSDDEEKGRKYSLKDFIDDEAIECDNDIIDYGDTDIIERDGNDEIIDDMNLMGQPENEESKTEGESDKSVKPRNSCAYKNEYDSEDLFKNDEESKTVVESIESVKPRKSCDNEDEYDLYDPFINDEESEAAKSDESVKPRKTKKRKVKYGHSSSYSDKKNKRPRKR